MTNTVHEAATANTGLFTARGTAIDPVPFRVVKLFDVGQAPAFIQDAVRPIALVHANRTDGSAIWEVTVGTYDWQDAAEEWGLHRWLLENGAEEKETVLLRYDNI